jgi:integrase
MSQPSEAIHPQARHRAHRRAGPRPAPNPCLARVSERIAARGLSASTAKIYLSWIRRFLEETAAEDLEPVAAIDRFMAHLEASQASEASRRQALAALAFFHAEVHWLDPEPLLDRHRPRAGRGRHEPPVRPAARYFAGLGPVIELIQRLARATGCSPAEIARARIGDLDLERCELKIRANGRLRALTRCVHWPVELRDALVDQVGESWRLHQLDLLDDADGWPADGTKERRLTTELFRRFPLFPDERRGPGRQARWGRESLPLERLGPPD